MLDLGEITPDVPSLLQESTTTRQRRKRHTVAGIEQLRSPIRSSSSSVEGGGGEGSSDTVSAVMSRMPLVDLTSLAPENQQAVSQVREGWKEGTASKTEADLTASQSAATANVKDVAQRIHGIILLLSTVFVTSIACTVYL